MTLSFLGHRFDLDSRATAFFKNGELFQKLSGDKTTAEILSNVFYESLPKPKFQGHNWQGRRNIWGQGDMSQPYFGKKALKMSYFEFCPHQV